MWLSWIAAGEGCQQKGPAGQRLPPADVPGGIQRPGKCLFLAVIWYCLHYDEGYNLEGNTYLWYLFGKLLYVFG